MALATFTPDNSRIASLVERDAIYASMTAITNALIAEASRHPLESDDRERLMNLAVDNAINTDRVMKAVL